MRFWAQNQITHVHESDEEHMQSFPASNRQRLQRPPGTSTNEEKENKELDYE